MELEVRRQKGSMGGFGRSAIEITLLNWSGGWRGEQETDDLPGQRAPIKREGRCCWEGRKRLPEHMTIIQCSEVIESLWQGGASSGESEGWGGARSPREAENGRAARRTLLWQCTATERLPAATACTRRWNLRPPGTARHGDQVWRGSAAPSHGFPLLRLAFPFPPSLLPATGKARRLATTH